MLIPCRYPEMHGKKNVERKAFSYLCPLFSQFIVIISILSHQVVLEWGFINESEGPFTSKANVAVGDEKDVAIANCSSARG